MIDESTPGAEAESPGAGEGPQSRVGKRLLERRQTREEGEPPVQKPIQAYVPEMHEAAVEKQAGPAAPPKSSRKLLGKELRHSLDADLEEEMAEAMASFADRADFSGDASGASNDPPAAEIERGTKMMVRVIDVRGDDIFVDLGDTSEGAMSILQFPDALPAAGDRIEVIVDRYDNENGLYLMRRPGSAQDADWGSVEKGMIVDAQVKGVNKGGLEVSVNGLRGFMPAGQADIDRIENLETLVGKTLRCEVTEANAASRNLVVSRRKVLEREREELAQKTREQIAVGKIFEGRVRKVMDFGAFVDIGGVDGLIHVSQLSWQKVRHPSQVVHEGDRVKVAVVSYDDASGKLGLSLRQLTENPWVQIAGRYAAGAIVTGKVTRATEFGAFVELEPGIEGLIHISELSGRRIARVTEVVQEGATVEVKVLEVDADRQRMSLSLKKAAAEAEAAAAAAVEDAEPEVATPAKPKKAKPLKGGLGGGSGPLFG
jgi:small subunit ribosomal protein S1